MGKSMVDFSKERYLIVNADDFGMCKSVNDAIIHLLQGSSISSATLMTPCSWAPGAAAAAQAHPEWDIGVHWTLTSEWSGYRWGPVAQGADVSTLVDGSGYFPAAAATVERYADAQQLRIELRQQVERFRRFGLQPTHADNHMGSIYGLQTGRDFLEVAMELCAEFGLPFRLPRRYATDPALPEALRKIAARAVEAADRLGVVLIDELINPPYGKREGETYEDAREECIRTIRGLRAGVSELILHPGFPTDELKAITPEWEKRSWELEMFQDASVRKALQEEDVRLIGWRELQDLQRSGRS
jgi:chitin disaccharide deacetylase